MPNHVTNLITAPTKYTDMWLTAYTDEQREAHQQDFAEREARRVKRNEESAAKGEDIPEYLAKPLVFEPLPEKFIDFNAVVPQPDGMESDDCRWGADGVDYRDEDGVLRHENGEACWHAWNTEKWGTKWNAYTQEVIDNGDGTTTLKFDTAWTAPAPAIVAWIDSIRRALTDNDESFVLDVRFVDEDLGHNCGHVRCHVDPSTEAPGENEFRMEVLVGPDGSDRAVRNEFAAQMKNGVPYAELLQGWHDDELPYIEEHEVEDYKANHEADLAVHLEDLAESGYTYLPVRPVTEDNESIKEITA